MPNRKQKALLERAEKLLEKLLDHDLPFEAQSGAAQIVDDLIAAIAESGDAREIEVLRHERDHARLQYQHSIDILVGIHQLTDPPPVQVDGKTMVFNNPHAAETLRELSACIRAIPDQIEATKKAAAFVEQKPPVIGAGTP